MEKRSAPIGAMTIADNHDDLHVLRRAFSLPKIEYIDISRQVRLKQMMLRWPLLAELADPTFSEIQNTEPEGQ